jgi:uncharacterized membrane protein YbaN (DUF454 family)
MKKVIITIVGGALVLLGAIFIIIPGPSLVLIIPGLMILSLQYPSARKWLKKAQRMARRSAAWVDRAILRKKYGA